MKIIKTDNLDRDFIPDVLIAENVPEQYATRIARWLCDDIARCSGDWFKAVPDNYKLHTLDPAKPYMGTIKNWRKSTLPDGYIIEGEMERFGGPGHTSLVLNHDEETGLVETRHSFYTLVGEEVKSPADDKYSCLFHAIVVENASTDRAIVLKLSTGHLWSVGRIEAHALRLKLGLKDGISLLDALTKLQIPLQFEYKLGMRPDEVFAGVVRWRP